MGVSAGGFAISTGFLDGFLWWSYGDSVVKRGVLHHVFLRLETCHVFEIYFRENLGKKQIPPLVLASATNGSE